MGTSRRGAWQAGTALVLVASLALLGAGVLAAAQQGQIALDRDAARRVRQAVNAARRRLGAGPLAEFAPLQGRADSVARAMALAVLANPEKPEPPAELKDRTVLDGLPRVGTCGFHLCGAASVEELATKAAAWEMLGHKELTHLGLSVCCVTEETGHVTWIAFGLGAQIVPEVSPELLSQGQRDFAFTCHLCGHQAAGRLVTPPSGDAGALAAVCERCKRRFDLFGLDTAGKFHRPPWFLRGFQPRKVSSPFDAWLSVLTGYQYMLDSKRFGRQEVWQLAEETHRWRQGDCEDTAILLADWLAASGYRARVVTGQVKRRGHAWVVLRYQGQDYLLETTGGRRSFRRAALGSAAMVKYFPEVQFERSGVWFRKRNAWTAHYFSDDEWARGPWTWGPARDAAAGKETGRD